MANQPLLTTSSKVKTYLNSPVGEADEAVIKDYVQIASRLVRSYCKRRFTSPKVTETRTYRTYGRTSVYVDEVFASSDITSVTDDFGMSLAYELDFGSEGETKGAELTVVPYSMHYGVQGLPEDHRDHFIRNLHGSGTTSNPKAIRVTATFGYAEGAIPREIEFATRRAAAMWFKEEIANYTEGAFISRGQQFVPEELPAIVIGMLENTWRVDTAVLI